MESSELASAFCFDHDSKRWIRYNSGSSFSLKGQKRLKFVTWKLWYDQYHLEARMEQLVKILEESDADFVALQQMTRKILSILEKSQYVRDNYYLSDAEGNTFNPTGVLILAKFPLSGLTLHPLESKASRQLLVGELKVNKTMVTISTACLEPQKLSTDHRIQQATSIHSTLSATPNCFLLLSANHWGFPEQQNIINSFRQFSDAWTQLYSNEQGLTVDTVVNGMIKKKDGEERRDRADFVLFKGGKWKVVEAKVIGNVAVEVKKRKNTGGTLEGVVADVGAVEDVTGNLGSMQVGPLPESPQKIKKKATPEVIYPCNHFGLLTTFEFNESV